ncbi:hypothetical protein WSM22_35770 [Cytophagales bacterium WSM2-2]|nr:hypothetical protein WSM22_35770 [Cytophagales bacterium WSM2-2]
MNSLIIASILSLASNNKIVYQDTTTVDYWKQRAKFAMKEAIIQKRIGDRNAVLLEEVKRKLENCEKAKKGGDE